MAQTAHKKPELTQVPDLPRVIAIYDRVMLLPEGKRREAVHKETEEDPGVRAIVLSLLDGTRVVSEFINDPSSRSRPSLSLALPPVPELAEGEVISDYRVIRELGRGAFARVYLCHQLSLERDVALKVLPDSFAQEAKVLAQLEHDHIVKIHAEDLLPERKLRLIAMQYIAGASLEKILEELPSKKPFTGRSILDVLDRIGTPTVLDAAAVREREKIATMGGLELVTWMGAHLADALHCAHERSILHLDVKPSNILVTAWGKPFLTDFNVAVRGSGGGALSGATPVGGTLRYTPPEQRRYFEASSTPRESVDARSDVYSLGVVMRELFARVEKGSGYQELEGIVARATEEHKVKRFPSALALSSHLRAFLDEGHGKISSARRPSGFDSPMRREQALPPKTPQAVARPREGRSSAVGGLLVVCFAALLGAGVWRWTAKSPVAESPTEVIERPKEIALSTPIIPAMIPEVPKAPAPAPAIVSPKRPAPPRQGEFAIKSGIRLVTPVEGQEFFETAGEGAPVFSWRGPMMGTNEKTSYVAELSRDRSFSRVISVRTRSASLSERHPPRLSQGRYYWRVRLVDAQGTTREVSEISQFTIHERLRLLAPQSAIRIAPSPLRRAAVIKDSD